MKRHAALVALSHDHHHALAHARRLRRAAEGAEVKTACTEFGRFFEKETIPHFREEEEELFPLVADREEARPLVVQALLEHQRLRSLVARLAGASDPRATMGEVGDVLEAHVRLEERELFPLIERFAATELEARPERKGGPIWGEASEDLNATLLAWAPGAGPAEHENAERDVAVCVVAGSATVTIDGDERLVRAGEAVLIGKGRKRKILAGPFGARYLSVHLRRRPLQIRRLDGGTDA